MTATASTAPEEALSIEGNRVARVECDAIPEQVLLHERESKRPRPSSKKRCPDRGQDGALGRRDRAGMPLRARRLSLTRGGIPRAGERTKGCAWAGAPARKAAAADQTRSGQAEQETGIDAFRSKQNITVVSAPEEEPPDAETIEEDSRSLSEMERCPEKRTAKGMGRTRRKRGNGRGRRAG